MIEGASDAHTTALAREIAARLAPWFERHHRDLPWRRTDDPYAIWVSEIMLQQTRVETVERYFDAFVRRFPSADALASASEQEVLEAWSGLGYYRRARLLHKGARHVVQERGGMLPEDLDELRAVPGVGRYTTGAIRAIAFDAPAPMVDGNVARVLSRVRAIEDPALQSADARDHWTLSRAVMGHGSPRVLAQALMELGATVCTPRTPRCGDCPLARTCLANARGLVEVIPARRKKTEQPLEILCALAVTVGDELMLIRRPDTGLLAGLWCLPLLAPDRRARTRRPGAGVLRRLLGRSAALEPTTFTVVRHVFTHRIWELHPVACKLERPPELHGIAARRVAWIRKGERPEGGIPSVTEKLLASLGY